MEILVVENVSLGGKKYGFFDKVLLTMFTILPALYARHIATITPEKHSVKVINERYEKINFDEHFDIVHINFTTSTAKRAYEIADIFRKKNIFVVLSGFHASLMPEEAKEHADSVLLGFGELNWLRLLEDFEKNQVKPFYQPIKYDYEVKIPHTKIDLPGIVLTGAIEVTRGCPYKCEFCIGSSIPGGSDFYKRPVDDVIDEIKKIPQKSFTFYDNSLTIDPVYTKDLFRKMKNLNKRFSCNGNLNVLAKDKELVKLSKEAGCVSWLIGFESINQKTLNDIAKTTNQVKEYKQAIKNIHENNMIVIGCFIFGFDNDTKEVFKDTLKTIKELEIDVVDFLILTPFPGTPLYTRLEKQNRIKTKDWSKYNMKEVVFTPKNLTAEELVSGVKNMYKEFYSLPYTVRRAVNSIKYGFYPFILVLERNLTAYMNSRKIDKTK